MYLPINDGVDHINIYTKGKTLLGRRLTNLSNDKVEVTGYGKFASLEGFWYYYLTGSKDESLRGMSGFEAKKHGRKIEGRIDEDGMTEEHKDVLREAIRCKLRQNKDLLKMLVESTLPLTHYYFYGKEDNPRVHYLEQFDWITEEIERIRKICKEYYNGGN